MQKLGFLSSYRPLNQLRPGSSFRGVPPPQSSFAHIARPSPFDVGSPTQGLFPHRGITRSASTSREGCQASAPFRPQVFATSRRFAPPSGFAGLFHPAATSRVVAVQGLLSPRSRDPSSRSRSPLPLSSRALTGPPGSSLSRPTGNPASTPEEASTSRLCSTRGRVAYGSGISLPAARSPLRFFSPPGRQPPPRLQFPQSHPLATIPSETLRLGVFYAPPRSAPSAALSVFQRRARFLGLPRNQPARDFRAFRPKSPW
jgi:hypothetical protein